MCRRIVRGKPGRIVRCEQGTLVFSQSKLFAPHGYRQVGNRKKIVCAEAFHQRLDSISFGKNLRFVVCFYGAYPVSYSCPKLCIPLKVVKREPGFGVKV